jgi:hypothetical protein
MPISGFFQVGSFASSAKRRLLLTWDLMLTCGLREQKPCNSSNHRIGSMRRNFHSKVLSAAISYLEVHDPLLATESAQPSHARQDSQCTPMALPYWPAIKVAVGSVTAALVVAYLEARYPSPPPEPRKHYGLPVTVDFARMADELAVDRRTLGLALLCVSTWWESEIRRVGAARNGREFVNHAHRRWPRLKLYSIVAEREWKSLETVALRRNWPLLTKTLADAGITSLCDVPSQSPLPPVLPCRDLEKFGEKLNPLEGLHEILLRGVELVGDRRYVKNPKVRRAVKQRPEPFEVVKEHREPSANNEAVDPALGDELVARLSRHLS